MTLHQAEQLFQHHAERVGLEGWTLTFKRRIQRFRTAGTCYYRRKTITLAPVYVELNSDENVTDTILHEIAHALLPPGAGHGDTWKRKAIEIGCDGKRTYDGKGVIKGTL